MHLAQVLEELRVMSESTLRVMSIDHADSVGPDHHLATKETIQTRLRHTALTSLADKHSIFRSAIVGKLASC